METEKIGALCECDYKGVQNQMIQQEKPVCVCYGVPLGFRAENTRIYDEKSTTLCNGTRAGHTGG